MLFDDYEKKFISLTSLIIYTKTLENEKRLYGFDISLKKNIK